MEWSLTKIANKIYLLEFEHPYDLAMHFLRVQEHYESPNLKFLNNSFTIIDYMEWYAKDNDNIFDYSAKWCGFNIPSSAMESLQEKGIKDWNKYDDFMKSIYTLIKHHDDTFYLIGARKNDSSTIKHELAHAFYSVIQEYKKEMDEKNQLDNTIIKEIKKYLQSIGYGDNVMNDETQAYLATSSTIDLKNMLKNKKISQKEIFKLAKDYNKTFKKYFNLTKKL